MKTLLRTLFLSLIVFQEGWVRGEGLFGFAKDDVVKIEIPREVPVNCKLIDFLWPFDTKLDSGKLVRIQCNGVCVYVFKKIWKVIIVTNFRELASLEDKRLLATVSRLFQNFPTVSLYDIQETPQGLSKNTDFSIKKQGVTGLILKGECEQKEAMSYIVKYILLQKICGLRGLRIVKTTLTKEMVCIIQPALLDINYINFYGCKLPSDACECLCKILCERPKDKPLLQSFLLLNCELLGKKWIELSLTELLKKDIIQELTLSKEKLEYSDLDSIVKSLGECRQLRRVNLSLNLVSGKEALLLSIELLKNIFINIINFISEGSGSPEGLPLPVGTLETMQDIPIFTPGSCRFLGLNGLEVPEKVRNLLWGKGVQVLPTTDLSQLFLAAKETQRPDSTPQQPAVGLTPQQSAVGLRRQRPPEAEEGEPDSGITPTESVASPSQPVAEKREQKESPTEESSTGDPEDTPPPPSPPPTKRIKRSSSAPLPLPESKANGTTCGVGNPGACIGSSIPNSAGTNSCAGNDSESDVPAER